MTTGKAILFSEMTPDASFERDFHDWYDTEHIPIRMKCEGFVSGQRYKSEAGPGFLAVYEMTDLSALKTPDYTQVKTQPSDQTRWMLQNVRGFTRYLGNEIHRSAKDDSAADAPILYAVWFNVPQDRAGEFNDWYESEHIPLLMKAPDWRMVRRFQITDGEPETWSHLALHYLAGKDALQSPEREAARKLRGAISWRPNRGSRAAILSLKGTATGISGSAPHLKIMDLKVSPVSVQQQAASKLRAAILAGVFQPGERLVEADLCERLGVSRPSVREALRSLEAEKLVAIVPNRGPLVPLITWEQAREIYQVRILLEGEAAAAFARRATAESIQRMQAALADFTKADKANDAFERVNATSRFYEEILNGCGNSVISDILNGLLARIMFLRSRSMSAPGRAKHSAREMKAILQAIQKRDADAARKAAVEHIEQASLAAQAIFAKR